MSRSLTETRTLDCELTEAEVYEKSKELAVSHVEKKHLTEEKAKVQTRIKKAENDIETLSAAIVDKKEEREVTCEWIPDYNASTKILVRTDTGEGIDTCPLNDNERQMTIVK